MSHTSPNRLLTRCLPVTGTVLASIALAIPIVYVGSRGVAYVDVLSQYLSAKSKSPGEPALLRDPHLRKYWEGELERLANNLTNYQRIGLPGGVVYLGVMLYGGGVVLCRTIAQGLAARSRRTLINNIVLIAIVIAHLFYLAALLHLILTADSAD